MRSITVLIMMIALASTVGCQATTKGQPGPVASAAESSASPTRSGPEAPDSDALALGAPPPPPEQFVAVPRLGDVRFDYDAYTIRPEDAPILDGNAAWLKANPDTLLMIEGHTDERGGSEYNLALGDRRASAAMSYLMAQGIPAARMVAISYGKERPLCAEPTEACWAQNRRARFLAKPR
jgi:peptidoglycan-associated lipoprotein